MNYKNLFLLYLTILIALLDSLKCSNNEATNINIIDQDDRNTLNVGQKLDEDTSKKLNVSQFRLLQKETPNQKPYAVYDNLISAREQILLKSFLTYDNTAWMFNNYDGENENAQRTYDNTAWINEKDPLTFSKTKLCEKLIAAVRDVAKDDSPYYPYRVFGKILRRGDQTTVAMDSNNTSEYTTMVFVNEFWRKNYYGELYFYDDNKEIVGGATHKSARVAVWRSDIYRLNRPPAVQFLKGQLLFQVQFTKDKSKMLEGHQNITAYRKEREEAHKNWFIPNYEIPGGIENLDIQKHKTFEYTTKTNGRKIFVYDNLFPEELLDHMRNFVLKYGTYFYDDSIDTTSDNVQWVAGFLLDPYIKSPYWKIIKKAAYESTGYDQMFPYDVSINLVRNADHTRIHGDVGYPGEEEFTCLVYLNKNWTKNFYGETAFFEKNSDDTDIVAQVRPRYGRLVIFDGNIPHSARPPSFLFSGARLTFVTKLHRNEYTGRRKNFQEELRFFRSSLQFHEDLKYYKGKKGEARAERYLKKLQDRQIKMSYHPDSERSDDDENNDPKQNLPDEEENSETIENQPDKIMTENEKLGKRYIVRRESPLLEDEEEVEKLTMKVIKPLLDLNEKSDDVEKKFKEKHEEMVAKSDLINKQYLEKVIDIL